MKFQLNKLLIHRKGYICDGSNRLYKEINLVKILNKKKNII